MKSWHCVLYIVVALLGVSIVTVYSTDISTFKADGNSYQFTKHILWICVGFLLLTAMANVDYHYLQKFSIPILVVTIILLVLVLVPGIGVRINGARRWIRFNQFLGIQPSEFAKLVAIIFISSYIAKYHDHMSELKCGLIIPMLVVVLISGLVIKEPDLGTSVFIVIISLIMLIVGGTRTIFVLLSVMAAAPFLYKMLFAYQAGRVGNFLEHLKDPSKAGYHIKQSWIALGSGGLTGLGIGSSKQKLFFLPESSSDFIFTIIGEELGFLGVVVIISLFLLLVWQGLKIAHKARDMFGFLLGLGITTMFGLQAVINVAVVSGTAPTKGIPLPFVSSGGSSLLFSMIGVGILVNVARQSVVVETLNVSIDNREPSEDTVCKLLPVRIWQKIASKIAGFSW